MRPVLDLALLCLVLYNLVATLRVLRSPMASGGQKAAQLVVVWCVPLLGALLTLHLLGTQRARRRGSVEIEGDFSSSPVAGTDAHAHGHPGSHGSGNAGWDGGSAAEGGGDGAGGDGGGGDGGGGDGGGGGGD